MTDLRSDWIFNANNTDAGQLANNVLLTVPVRISSHLKLVDTWSTCKTTTSHLSTTVSRSELVEFNVT